MKNEELKPIVDDILGFYFNTKTRFGYNRNTQKEMINQNRGLLNACDSLVKFADNEEELVAYIKNKLIEINSQDAQEVSF